MEPSDEWHRSHMRVTAEILRCPVCRSTLREERSGLYCSVCLADYPIIAGVPILIVDHWSVFARGDYQDATPAAEPAGGLRHWLHRLLPKTVNNTDFIMEDAVREIAKVLPDARILVVGCGDNREGTATGARFIYTDVTFGPLVDLICDAHDLPFGDGEFDAVLAASVLEHVMRPWRCVEEFERVLKPGGFVFAATPFMQQVHMGRYDFTRFTYLGHRALFSGFEELRSGIANGPGTALAWSLQYFALSFPTAAKIRTLASFAARLFVRPLCAIDEWFLNYRPGAYDGASGFYFFGRKIERRLTPREILTFHRGLNPH